MIISNGNMYPPQMTPPANNAISLPRATGALNSSMISRIHSIKPGCGGCGRRA